MHGFKLLDKKRWQRCLTLSLPPAVSPPCSLSHSVLAAWGMRRQVLPAGAGTGCRQARPGCVGPPSPPTTSPLLPWGLLPAGPPPPFTTCWPGPPHPHSHGGGRPTTVPRRRGSGSTRHPPHPGTAGGRAEGEGESEGGLSGGGGGWEGGGAKGRDSIHPPHPGAAEGQRRYGGARRAAVVRGGRRAGGLTGLTRILHTQESRPAGEGARGGERMAGVGGCGYRHRRPPHPGTAKE